MSSSRGIIEELRRAVEGDGSEGGGGESMGAIARRADMTPGEISRYLRGQRVPTLAKAERIAKALGGKLVLRRRRRKLATDRS